MWFLQPFFAAWCRTRATAIDCSLGMPSAVYPDGSKRPPPDARTTRKYVREAVVEALLKTCGKRTTQVVAADVHAVVRYLIRREPEVAELGALDERLQRNGGAGVYAIPHFADSLLEWEAERRSDVEVLNR